MRIPTVVIAGMFCAVSLTFVFADPKPAIGPRGHHADKNKDGVVDHKEMQMEKKEHFQKAIVSTPAEVNADTNKDGIIEPVEARAWQHHKARVNTSLEARYDTNNNGWLEPAESRQLVKDKYELIKTNGKAKVDTDLEKQYDANKDGILDKVEAKQMFEDAK